MRGGEMRPGNCALTIIALAFFVACSAASKNEDKDEMAPQPIMAGSGDPGDMDVDKGDVNGDGKPDVWNYFREVNDPASPGSTMRVMIRKQADLNFDGKKDITREFDDEGTLVLEEADLDYDGAPDQINIYTKGVLAEKRIYRAGVGKIFLWKFYENGKMIRFHRDDNLDGRPDYCELWYQGEKLSKKGWDKDGDGECDYWEAVE